ncbi:MAG: hypothetical protein MHPSP_002959, partial [Paramarteilia canceri]
CYNQAESDFSSCMKAYTGHAKTKQKQEKKYFVNKQEYFLVSEVNHQQWIPVYYSHYHQEIKVEENGVSRYFKLSKIGS